MADVNLTQDMNIVAQSGLEIELLGDDLNIIQKLDDEPNDVGGMTSAELKETFDRAGNIIKEYINETLIPAVIAEDATENARAAAEDARVLAEESRAAAEQQRADETAGIVSRATEQARLAQSWAVGGTGVRAGEDANNAKYYASIAKQAAGGDFVTPAELEAYAGRIVSGTYIGTGTHYTGSGLSGCNELTFEATPALLLVFGNWDSGFLALMADDVGTASGQNSLPGYPLYTLAWGKTVRWGSDHPAKQRNTAGRTYGYIAFFD